MCLSKLRCLWKITPSHPFAWLFVGLDYQYMVFVRFLSLVLVSGTVFRLISIPRRQLTFQNSSKNISLLSLFSLIILTNFKVPVRCLWHFGHYNRSLLLLLLLLLLYMCISPMTRTATSDGLRLMQQAVLVHAVTDDINHRSIGFTFHNPKFCFDITMFRCDRLHGVHAA